MAWTDSNPNLGTNVDGRVRTKYVTVTGPASYASTGFALTAAELGLKTILFFPSVTATTGATFVYDHANEKVKVMQVDNSGTTVSNLIEVADATNLSAVSVKVKVDGI